MPDGYERRSWRSLTAGDRVYDPRQGNPEVLSVYPTSKKTRRWVGCPGWYATTGTWRLVPRTGVVKVVTRKGRP